MKGAFLYPGWQQRNKRHQLSKGRGKIEICLSIKVTIHCIKPRCASTKTPFSNCGPCGCQLRAVRLPAAGRTARNRKTKKYIRDKHILQGASGSFPPGIGTLYPGDCPAHTRYNPIFHTVFRMQAQSIIRRKTAGIRCKRHKRGMATCKCGFFPQHSTTCIHIL